MNWLLIGSSLRRGFCRPVKREKPPSGRDMPSVIREYSRSMIPFKAILTASHQPSNTHTRSYKEICNTLPSSACRRAAYKLISRRFIHVRRKYKVGAEGVLERVMCYSKWEKQLFQKYSGKIQQTTARFSPLYENYIRRRSFETHCQQPASLN